MPSLRLHDRSSTQVSWESLIYSLGSADADIGTWVNVTDGVWPELLGALFQASKSPDASHREGAFRIFTTTPGIIEKQHSEAVRGAFQAGFSDESLTVWLSRYWKSRLG